MTASLWVAAPRSIPCPRAGDFLAVLVGPATVARSSIGVTTIGLAANLAQSALSFTPIDPRITIGLGSVAWPAVCAWRSVFRSTSSFMTKEFGTMKKLSLFAIRLAKFDLVMLLGGIVSAHPGVEGTAIDSHQGGPPK